jgi:hypothetical protein
MKKSIFAVIMAIVMLFSVVTVYAYDNYTEDAAVENSREACPFCGGVMRNTVITNLYGTKAETYACTQHSNCEVIDFYDKSITVCAECGYLFSWEWHLAHTTHNMQY